MIESNVPFGGRIIYQFNYIGGPKGGVTEDKFQPKCRVVIDSSLYEIQEPDTESDYIQWVDDNTRSIDLHYKGPRS